jgi:hypothetical protein
MNLTVGLSKESGSHFLVVFEGLFVSMPSLCPKQISVPDITELETYKTVLDLFK